MILNDIDLGGSHPFLAPDSGISVGSYVVEGSRSYPVARGSKLTTHNVTAYVRAWQSIGGQAAYTIPATRYLLRQCEELARNRDMGPVYIRWTQTADSSALLRSADLADGWYWITSFKPEYKRLMSGLVPVQMQVTEIAQGGATSSVGFRYAPSSPGLSSNYSGAAAANLLALPVGSTNPGLATRTGAEGAIPFALSPSLNPTPIILSATSGQWFQGRCRVYDTINTGTYPVPTSGAFVNNGWVEVYDIDHRFEGDCVITNGLHLYLLSAGATGVSSYLWNTALATPAWQQFGSVQTWDQGGGSVMTLRSMQLTRIGREAAEVAVIVNSPSGYYSSLALRLERGSYFIRFAVTPKNFTASTPIVLLPQWSTNTIGYDSGKVLDNGLSAEQFVAGKATDYGYSAYFAKGANGATYPMVVGFLFQNQASSADLDMGANNLYTSDSIASGTTVQYGVFAIPYGVSGSYSAANLQQEAESGTKAGAWVSVADAAASAGNAAKLPSGTVAGSNNLTGASFTPPAGTYRMAVRYRNSGVPSGGTELQVSTYINGAAGNTINFGSGTGSVASYLWALSAVFTLNGSQTFTYTASDFGVNNASVDWFIDEVVLIPLTLTADNRGPQDLFQQFLADRAVRFFVA